jgi:uncharacterized protein (TIGR02594 family)
VKNFFAQLLGFLSRLFNKPAQVAPVPVVHEEPKAEVPVVVTPPPPTPEMLRAAANLKVVAQAQKFIGVREKGGPNRGKEVEMFQKAVDGKAEGEPWCMAFVQFCVEQVEAATGFDSQLFRTEHCLTTWLKTPVGLRTMKPEPGCIVLWQHGRTSNGHTGIVTKVLSDKAAIRTVEGNTGSGSAVVREGDGVYERERSMNGSGDMHILGYIKPF